MGGPATLPRRVIASIGNSIDAGAELPSLQRELLGHLRSIDQGIAALRELLEPMRTDIAEAKHAIEAFDSKVAAIERRVAHIDAQIPGSDGPGPIQKAKNAVTGGP